MKKTNHSANFLGDLYHYVFDVYSSILAHLGANFGAP